MKSKESTKLGVVHSVRRWLGLFLVAASACFYLLFLLDALRIPALDESWILVRLNHLARVVVAPIFINLGWSRVFLWRGGYPLVLATALWGMKFLLDVAFWTAHRREVRAQKISLANVAPPDPPALHTFRK